MPMTCRNTCDPSSGGIGIQVEHAQNHADKATIPIQLVNDRSGPTSIGNSMAKRYTAMMTTAKITVHRWAGHRDENIITFAVAVIAWVDWHRLGPAKR